LLALRIVQRLQDASLHAPTERLIFCAASVPSGVTHSSLRRRSTASGSRRTQPRASSRVMTEPKVAASNATLRASVTWSSPGSSISALRIANCTGVTSKPPSPP
jgi:hypothetical protein